MRIAVNTRFLIQDKLEGIGWFTYETMKRITAAHPEHEFYFFFDRSWPDEFIFQSNVTPIRLYPPARRPFLYELYFEYSIPFALRRNKIDAFISTDGFIPLKSPVKTLSVIHDINFEHRPQDIPKRTLKYYKKHFPQFARNATRIATVSEFSKQDIAKTYQVNPDKIDVVYNGCNPLYGPIDEDLQRRTRLKYAAGKPYFLYVGSMHSRKNIIHLLMAFDTFKRATRSDVKLVLVGSHMWGKGEIGALLPQLTCHHDIFFTGNIPSLELKNVLASALALTYVPYFEGFGIPVLEAFYSEIPVMTSDCTSLPEVAGKAALFVDPASVESISQGMMRLAQDEILREKLVIQGKRQRDLYSWDKTAAKLWTSFEKMIG